MRVYFESDKVNDRFDVAKLGLVGIGLILAMSMSACGTVIGPAGPKGDTGATGSAGAAGSNGTNGIDASCSVSAVLPNLIAPAGGSLIACSDGTHSLVLNGSNGINGTNGVNGVNGVNGTNGTNGSNGTVVTAIQFCSGVVGSYPSTFPEIGFCINDEIYAVYSANGGFLTKVLPGTWSSDGINASCTFTVGPHCQVN